MKLPAYPKYKPIEIDWLGDVPKHWIVKRARFLLQLNKPAITRDTLSEDDEVSFVPMESVGIDGGLSLLQSKLLAEIGNGYTEFQDGDVVVAKITPCFENGKAALVSGLLNGLAYGTTELHVLRSGHSLERRFLFYVCISSLFRKLGESEMYGAGGQKRVPPEFIQNFNMPLPPIAEQQAIADFLDRETGRMDLLIEKKRKLIERLKEKRTALISRTVTRGLPPTAARAAGLPENPKLKPSGIEWLGDIPEHWAAAKSGFFITIQNGYAFPSSGFTHDENDVKLLRGINIGVSVINWEETVYWARSQGDGLDDFELEAGTLVIGMDRPWISSGVRVAIIEEKDLPCLLLQRVAAIKFLPMLNRDFFYRILSSPLFVDYFTPDTTGVSVPHISPDQIKKFPIPVPPLSEQQAIADYLDRETAWIDALVRKVEVAIERLQEYRTALITAAVTGKIDVRGAV